MDMQKITLWQLIEVLSEYPSLEPTALAAVLPVAFRPTTRNAYFAMHEADGVALADGVNISHVQLRTRLDDAARGLIVLDLEGACVSLDDVRQRVPSVALTNAPRGRSPNETTGFSAEQAWGTLSFGFKERSPGCLASVVIDRTAAKAG